MQAHTLLKQHRHYKHWLSRSSSAASVIWPHRSTITSACCNLVDDCILKSCCTVHQVLDDIAPSNNPDIMQDRDASATADLSQPLAKQKLLYCERFVEFLTDLLSQLPTRRFIRTLLEDRAILTKCRMSALFQNPQGKAALCGHNNLSVSDLP